MKNKQALLGGGYSLLLTGVVLAILVAVNVLMAVLPATWTLFDMSASKLYSITSNTKVVVNQLEEDVTIYWIVQADMEDDIIEILLGKYEGLSEHIQVVKKNPDVYPTFAEQYTDEVVENNSLIVVCGDRSRYIGLDDIYVEELDVYSYSYTTSFDGEGAITSAIDYVVSEDLPQLYVLEGHGEASLPATFSDQIEKENIEITTLSLLTTDKVPEEADCVLIYAPASDISETEQEILANYVEGGGKLFVMAGPVEDESLDHLYELLAYYGVERTEGLVLEEDQNYYFYGYPLVLLPQMNSHEITNSLIEANYSVVMPLVQGLTVTGDPGDATVTALLTTSDTSFSKVAGFAFETNTWEEGDIDGPFAIAYVVETVYGGGMVWFSSDMFLEDMYNSYSSGANGDLAMNALASLIGETESMAIRSKSLNYNYLTISESASAFIKFALIGAFPLLYFGFGVCVILKRREQQNEAV